MFFGNYKKLMYLAQTEDIELQKAAQQAATSLGLEYDYYYTGMGDMAPAIVQFVESNARPA